MCAAYNSFGEEGAALGRGTDYGVEEGAEQGGDEGLRKTVGRDQAEQPGKDGRWVQIAALGEGGGQTEIDQAEG